MSAWTLDRAVSLAMCVTALTLAGSVAYRTFVPSRRVATSGPSLVSSWQSGLEASVPVSGDDSARVKMLVLSDLECSACRDFHERTQEILRVRQGQVQLFYVPFPLTMHRFALPAARAAECAQEAGALGGWIQAVYQKQDSLGIKSWGSYAADAGITDTTAIARCARESGVYPRIDAGTAFARKIGSSGTPTVLLNGWHFPQPPSNDILTGAIDALLRGESLAGKRYSVPAGPVLEAR